MMGPKQECVFGAAIQMRPSSSSESQRSRGLTGGGVSMPSIGLRSISPRLTAQRKRRRKTAKTLRIFAICARGMRSKTATMSRSEEHTSELQSLMRISYAVFCLKKKKKQKLIAKQNRH